MAEQDLWSDLLPLLDQEISRLPEKYRTVIVLCELEGLTGKEAALHLGLPEGTVASRLSRARTMLTKRLARHSLAVSGSTLAAALSQNAASAAMPGSVLTTTIHAVTRVAAGANVPGGVISAKVAALTERVLKTMLLTKLRKTIVVLLTLAILGIGGITLAFHALAADQPGSQKEAAADQAIPQKDVAGKPVRALKKAEPTLDDFSKVLGIYWWQFELPNTIEAVEIGIREAPNRFDLIEKMELKHLELFKAPFLKIACQHDGSGEYRL